MAVANISKYCAFGCEYRPFGYVALYFLRAWETIDNWKQVTHMSLDEFGNNSTVYGLGKCKSYGRNIFFTLGIGIANR
jgi:hypothetical protein